MSIVRRVAPYVAAAITSPAVRLVRYDLAELMRRIRMQPHQVLYFHQVDDPYSQLASQILAELEGRYKIKIVPHLVGPPPDAAAPERQRLIEFARRDAIDIAKGLDLVFPKHATTPTSDDVLRAHRLLAGLDGESFAQRAKLIGHTLWVRDEGSLRNFEASYPAASQAEIDRALAIGMGMREHLGHYSGAMFWYGNEWYWGVDRLHHLEQRLIDYEVRRPEIKIPAIIPIPRSGTKQVQRPANHPITVEFFASLRSPYSYIAMQRVLSLPERFPVQLQLRPVLPMVMRGLPVPADKRMYITLDTKREAERVGVDFGFICDPVGKPVEMGFSLWRWASAQGRGGQYLHAFTRAAFAEGVDCGTEAGLRHVVQQAGLDWAEAQSHRSDSDWRAELEANREELFAMGLWGVPSFRVRGGNRPDYSTWGQDRLWRVEEEIIARLD